MHDTGRVEHSTREKLPIFYDGIIIINITAFFPSFIFFFQGEEQQKGIIHNSHHNVDLS
jgi:hypothetical protein